ncbi:Uncharacterized protein dnm_008870 [Desulfonema magnum]|uniref:Uncharacterized protein n=1 Tax=Desulfonema magnum TaxID=45655 RepID=A0A975GKM1_9BACT|nr:Uncharacterized protein dnm_008870 [Desulfonema magnum]
MKSTRKADKKGKKFFSFSYPLSLYFCNQNTPFLAKSVRIRKQLCLFCFLI